MQVADRFHLLQNLTETLEVALIPHAGALRRMGRDGSEASGALPEPPAIQPSQATVRATYAAERHAHRLDRHDAVWTMHRQGWRVENIAAHLGISRATVKRHLRDRTPPPRTRRRLGSGATLVTPWQQVVADRWQAGQRSGRALHRELQHQGFTASYPTLARHLQALRRVIAQRSVSEGVGSFAAGEGEERQPRPRLLSRCT